MQNGIMGDLSTTQLPTTEIDEKTLVEEKKLAKYSKSEEYQKIKEHFEQRIEFYQSYLPDGRPLTEVDITERANMWVIANAVIAELQLVLSAYEQAKEAVDGTITRTT